MNSSLARRRPPVFELLQSVTMPGLPSCPTTPSTPSLSTPSALARMALDRRGLPVVRSLVRAGGNTWGRGAWVDSKHCCRDVTRQAGPSSGAEPGFCVLFQGDKGPA